MTLVERPTVSASEQEDVLKGRMVKTFASGGLIDGYRINGHIVTVSGGYVGTDPHEEEIRDMLELEQVAGLLGESATKHIFGE